MDNLLWCRSEITDNLFNAQVYFKSGNSHLFKVWVDVTLKDLKEQLNEATWIYWTKMKAMSMFQNPF